jgi:hypothetical protein
MNIFIQKHLMWTAAQATTFIAGRTDEAVVKEMLSWEHDAEERQVSAGLYYQILHLLKRQQYVVKLTPWAVLYGKQAQEFVDDASIFEFFTACKVNPFYPLNAFRVPFDACRELAKVADHAISEDALAYALVSHHLCSHDTLPVADAARLFAQEGLHITVPAQELQPYPPSHLATHPFREYDVTVTPPCVLADLLQHRGQIISSTRERKHMGNALMQVGNAYCWENFTMQFVKETRAMKARFKPYG